MLLWTVLLRVLLCVGLIFNGSGAAVASARMQLAHVQPAQAAFDSQVTKAAGDRAEAKPACHEDAASVAQADHHAPDIDSTLMARPQAPDGHSPDCCESGACQCDCVHQMQVLADANAPDIEVEPTDSVRSMMSAHVPPTLPHLIRPPIHPVS